MRRINFELQPSNSGRITGRRVVEGAGVMKRTTSDKFLKKTLQIESAQMETSDPKRLRELLD